jgi:hypothetical protein
MATIADLIGLDIAPEEKKRRKERASELTSPADCSGVKPSDKYECEVFNFLLDKKDTLGIQSVIRFKNLRVDGAIVLANGRRMVVEAKFRMNWKKALEASYEFKRFLLSEQARTNPVNGAVVFFEKFEGSGWDRTPKCRLLENGWNEWYRSFHRVEGYPLDLLRLHEGVVESYSTALASRRVSKNVSELAGAIEKLSDADKAQLADRLTSQCPPASPV